MSEPTPNVSTGRRRPSGPVSLARALVVVSALALAACGGADDSDPSPSPPSQPQTTATSEPGDAEPETTDAAPPSERTEPVPVTGETVAEMAGPIWIMPRPGDDHLWVSEREGRVRRVAVGADGTLAADADPVLDISDQIRIEFEHGLFAHAFDPEGDRLFVSYTDNDGDSVVARYDIDGNSVDESSREELFLLDQPHGNHNGGHVVFHDGDLWLGMGDGGSAGDPDKLAQDPDVLYGKMIRIDPDSGAHEWVSLGLRNPWRFAFDPDGRLWIADVGQGSVEEINRVDAEEIDGANFGWSGWEGSEEFWDGEDQRSEDAIFPVFEYGREGGNCSITGGFVYQGTAIDGLQGAFLFADLCAGNVRAVRVDDQGELVGEYDLGVSVESPWSFGFDADGEPFVLSMNGEVVRIVPAS